MTWPHDRSWSTVNWLCSTKTADRILRG
jgi:hypothetical protein